MGGVYCLGYVTLSCFLAFIFTAYLAPLCSALSTKLKILDIPDGLIKKHEKPIPYFGGIAIYIGFISALALLYPFENNIFLLLIGVTLLLFIGLLDDIVRIKHYQKFFGQLIAVYCFLKSGIHLKEQFFLNHIINIPLSALWIASIINAFNLIDVMDGLATLVACGITVNLFIIAVLVQQFNLAILLSCFLGSLLGFYIYNKPPASIYMGDTGSLFIGGFLATIPFLIKWSYFANTYGFFACVIILSIPLYEIVALICIRTLKGIPFYQASSDHFAHYLQHFGLSKKQILGSVVLTQIGLIAFSVLFVLNKISLILGALIFYLSMLISLWLFLSKKVYKL